MTVSYYKKSKIFALAVFVACLFHVSGYIGMQTASRNWFISMTPLTLTLMAVLLFFTDTHRDRRFYLFFLLCFVTGYLSELIGINTGLLFGNYTYGSAMGVKIAGVPLMIGIQWFVTVYCAGQLTKYILNKTTWLTGKSAWPPITLAAIGGGLTTLYDYLLEPAAIRLGYWTWLPDGVVPFYNYVCWYLISSFLLFCFFFRENKNEKINAFALILMLIQAIFFILQ